MPQRQKIRCPCKEPCEIKKAKRPIAVNLILQNEICTAGELRKFLPKSGLGTYATRKSIEFLSSGNCKLIGVFKSPVNDKELQLGRHGKLFFKKTVSATTLRAKMVDLLTPLQRRILDKFTRVNRRIYYFSMYDLRKLLPYPGNVVEYSVNRLTKLGLINKLNLKQTTFYVHPLRLTKLVKQGKIAIIDDELEFALIKVVHELIMNLYPPNSMRGYHDCIRPRTPEVLAITGGMTFDIFYQFLEPFAGRNYLAVDVYTRIPVSGYIVHSFMKKIEWAKTRSRTKDTNYLKDKTFGFIVFRNATPRAITLANKFGIRFLRLSNIKVDYKKLRKSVEDKYETESKID